MNKRAGLKASELKEVLLPKCKEASAVVVYSAWLCWLLILQALGYRRVYMLHLVEGEETPLTYIYNCLLGMKVEEIRLEDLDPLIKRKEVLFISLLAQELQVYWKDSWLLTCVFAAVEGRLRGMGFWPPCLCNGPECSTQTREDPLP
jgi:hypothetical protein